MAEKKTSTPQFFDNDFLDPVRAATGPAKEEKAPKKKAGFYLSLALLDRFNRKFHELNLSGVAIENKSALLEAALAFALDDMDKGEKSRALKRWFHPKDANGPAG
jgi:hypothetical protein